MKYWKVKLLLCAFAFGISNSTAQAQENEFERRKAEVLAETVDTVLAENYARLSYSYVNIDIDSACHYASKCISFSQEIEYRLGEALGYNLLSITYGARSMLDSAIISLLTSLEIFEELNDSLGMADCYGNLGIIYDRTNQHQKAIEFGLKDLAVRVNSKDTLGLMNTLTNLINYHLNQDDLEGASTYYEMMKGIVVKEDGSQFHGMLVQAGAFIHFLKKDYQSAREGFIEAMAIWHPQRDYLEWGHASAYKGRCEFYLGMYEDAKQSIDTALKVYENVGSWMYHFEEFLFMSKVDSALGNYESAYNWHREFTERELERLKTQKLVELALMQDQFESSLKEAENKALTDQNTFQELIISRQRIIGVAIIVCLVVLGILAIYLLRVNIIIKQKSAILELQKEQIESQNAKLERLNEVKSKMISIISHDFRSPLVSVQSTMSILEQMGKSENTFKQLLPELKSKVDYAAELVDNLLLWANDHLEDTNLNLEDFQLKPFIERKTIYFYELAKRKGVKLSIEDLAETTLHTDKMMLHSVYRNLVSNALKFTPSGGEIRISAFESGDSVVITVADTGVGMDEETQNTIRQGQSVSRIGTNKEMGSGLGLLICQDFIKRLKGSFHFDSNPGKGTQFYVQIPKSI